MCVNRFVFSFLLALSLFCLPQAALAEWPFGLYTMMTGTSSVEPVIADIDGDGSLEVVFTSWDGNLYCTDAAGNQLWTYALSELAFGPNQFSTPTLANVDDDPTTLEVVVGTGDDLTGGGRLIVVGSDGQLLAQFDTPAKIDASPVVVDADLDGANEIYFAPLWSAGSNTTFYALDPINGLEGLSLQIRWTVTDPKGYGTVAAANLTGDEKLEIVMSNGAEFEDGSSGRQLRCYDAFGQVVWEIRYDYGVEPVLADFDGDQIPDVLYAKNDVNVYVRDGATGEIKKSLPFNYLLASLPVVTDLDKDGSNELIVAWAEPDYGHIAIDVDGQQLWSILGDQGHNTPTVGDLDGDGSLELLIVTSEMIEVPNEEFPGFFDYVNISSLSAYTSDRQHLWTHDLGEAGMITHPSLADLDGDGSLEILFGYGPDTMTAPYYLFNALDKDGNQFQLVNQYELTDTAPWPSKNSSPSNNRVYTPPVFVEAPGQINVTSLDEDGQFPIKWWYSATPDATYQLEESADAGATWAPVPEYADTATREVIRTNLANGYYQYRVRAVKADCESSEWVYSSVCQVEIAVGPVRELSVPATKADGRIYVSWKRSLTAGATYIAEQQVDGGAWAPVAEYVDPTSTSFYMKDQFSGSYVFRIMAARDGAYFSDWVTSAPCVMTYDIIADPLDVNAEFKLYSGKVLVTWQGPVEPAAMAMAFAEPEPQTKYKVEKSSDGGVTWSLLYWTYKLQAWMPVEDNLTYQFRVSAHKPGSAASAYVVSPSIEIKLVAPPSNMFVKTADPDGQFPIFWWHSPTEGVTYELEESIDGGAWAPVAGFTEVTANKTIKTGAVNGSYQFRIRAVKAGFEPSDWAYSTTCVVGG